MPITHWTKKTSASADPVALLRKEALDAGTQDGLHGTPFPSFAEMKRTELERAVCEEVEREVGRAPDVESLRAAARLARERLDAARAEREKVRRAPVTLRARALLGFGMGLLTLMIGWRLSHAWLEPLVVATALGLVVALVARLAQDWWVEGIVKRALHRETAKRLRWGAAEERADRFLSRMVERTEAELRVLSLKYAHGQAKGRRLAALLRGETTEEVSDAQATNDSGVFSDPTNSEDRDTLSPPPCRPTMHRDIGATGSH